MLSFGGEGACTLGGDLTVEELGESLVVRGATTILTHPLSDFTLEAKALTVTP